MLATGENDHLALFALPEQIDPSFLDPIYLPTGVLCGIVNCKQLESMLVNGTEQ